MKMKLKWYRKLLGSIIFINNGLIRCSFNWLKINLGKWCIKLISKWITVLKREGVQMHGICDADEVLDIALFGKLTDWLVPVVSVVVIVEVTASCMLLSVVAVFINVEDCRLVKLVPGKV